MERYKKLGFKLTPQRIAVLEIMEGNKTHPSAEEVFEQVRGDFPTISFATVYNTLNLLRDRRALVELAVDSERKRFDPNIAPHHHIICTKCREVVDVFKDISFELDADEAHGYDVLHGRVDFVGLCPRCKASAELH